MLWNIEDGLIMIDTQAIMEPPRAKCILVLKVRTCPEGLTDYGHVTTKCAIIGGETKS